MYDHSFLELEEIKGNKRLSYEVLKPKYLAYKGSKKWGNVEAYSNGIRTYQIMVG